MPYQLIKVGEDKYFVGKVGQPKYYSKNPLTRSNAMKQLTALNIEEHNEMSAGFNILDSAKSVVNKVKDVALNVLNNDRSFTLEKYEKKYYDYYVTDVAIMRIPVESALKKILSIVSLGTFDKIYKQYDDIYHLFIVLRLYDRQTKKQSFLQLEKRPNIAIKEVGNFENKEVTSDNRKFYHLVNQITFGELFTKVRKADGGNLFRYTPTEYNCQQFI